MRTDRMMERRSSRWLPTTIALAVCATVSALLSGTAEAAPRQDRLDGAAYQALLAEVRGGLFITSGRALAGSRPDSVEAVVADFIASGPKALELAAAALLHTEAASYGPSDTHLEMARNLLRAIPDPDQRTDWTRRWWLALGYSYQVQLLPGPGVAAFGAALEDLPQDSELRIAFARALWMFGRQREEPSYLDRAREILTGLLEETPDQGELRVQLAGVLLDSGQTEAALEQLDRLEGVRLGGSPRFAAFMLRGEAALSAGDFEAAEAAFAQAVRRARRSPSAVAGLVAARRSLGDDEGAAEAATSLLERRSSGWEPEWRYWLGPALDYAEMFQAMKDEVRAPAGSGSEGGRP